MLWGQCAAPDPAGAGGGTRGSPEVPSSPHNFVIFFFFLMLKLLLPHPPKRKKNQNKTDLIAAFVISFQ